MGTTRDAMATSVKLTTLCLICYGIALLAAVISADGPTSLGATTTPSNPSITASGNTTHAANGDASHVVSSLVVVAFGAIFGWFF